MATLTSTWSWLATLAVQGTSIQCRSRGPKQSGNPCQGIGVKTGKATPCSIANLSHFKSLPVMEGPLLVTMQCRLIGNLAKHLRGVNSKFSRCHGLKNFVYDVQFEGG
ncbi:hypothetical protein CsSME_00028836 [Camellia sinensis var. sinensis]